MGYIVGVGAVFLLVVIWAAGTYNSFVTLVERVNNAKSQIAVQIESRWDAIKSLIEATKQYSKQEAETLEQVTRQRTTISRDSSVAEMEEAEAQIGQIMGRLLAVSEAYPDLKASTLYQTSMEKIDKYENNVRQSRMIYNDTVTRYNRKIKVFPSSALANMFSFTEEPYFEGTETKQDMPSWE